MPTEREPDELQDEYDFGNGVRGQYADRFARGVKVVTLDRDVADLFPDAESVNRALRSLAEIVREARKKPAHS